VEPTRDEAVDALFRRHYRDLVRLAYCLVGERTQAEDAVQDAFLSLYRQWNRLDDRGASVAYLRSAVLNRCRSRIRDRIRERKAPVLGLLDQSGDDVESEAIAHDRGSRLVRAVQRLPRRQREVVICRFYLELSVAETASLLEIAAGSVKRHTHRAVLALIASDEEES
jgi:RNA polymerase sigma-70 factor (sigma-E family)